MTRIAYLTTIDFGPGELKALAGAVGELGIKRPLLVADRGVAAAGLVDKAMAFLPAGTPQFLDTPPNPTESAVKAALAAYRARKLRRDRCARRRVADRSRQGRGAARDA